MLNYLPSHRYYNNNNKMPATERSTKRKKTSFADQPSVITNPKEISKNATFQFLASLPKPIQLIGESIFHRFTKHCNDIDNIKTRTASLQSSTDKTPLSTKFNFVLNSTDTIKEQQEFKAAANRCREAIEYCQRLLKAEMLIAAELELADEIKKLKEYFCTATSLLAEAFIKNDPNTPNDPKSTQTLVYCTFEKEYRRLMTEEDSPSLTQESGDENNNNITPSIISQLFRFSGFKFKMTRLTDLDGFYNQFHTTTYGLGEGPPPPGSADSDDIELIGHLLRDFEQTLYNLFYTSRVTYKNAIESKKRTAELTAWAKNALDVQATEVIAMDIEEANLESPELGDLVESKIAEKLKKLETKITNQQKMINNLKKSKSKSNAKNSTGTGKPKSTTPNNRRRAPKADAADKGTTTSNNDKKKKRKGKKPNQKKNTSSS